MARLPPLFGFTSLFSSPWRPRSLYTCAFLWVSVIDGRFLAPFLEHEAGLSSTQIGSFLALQQIVFVICCFFFGSWADKLEIANPGKGRAVCLSIGMILGGCMFLLHGIERLFPSISLPIFRSQFWHASLRIAVATSKALIFPVIDGMCLDYLKREPDSSTQNYGQERLYGAVSWAIANLLLSLTLDFFEGDFVVIYTCAGVVTVVGVVVVFSYARSQEGETLYSPQNHVKSLSDDSKIFGENDPSEIKTQKNNQDLCNYIKSEQMDGSQETISTLTIWSLLVSSWFGFSLMIAQITQSSGQAIVDNLIFLFFEALGSSYSLMGFTVVLTVAFEIPIFQVAPCLLRELGPVRLIQIASFSYVFRVLGYSLIPDGRVSYALFLEPLHGVTFACAATAFVEVLASSSIIPNGYEASGQALLSSFIGIGSVLGLFFGGWLEDTLGPRIMYRLSALVVFAGCGLFSCVACSSKNSYSAVMLSESEDGKIHNRGIVSLVENGKATDRVDDRECDYTTELELVTSI